MNKKNETKSDTENADNFEALLRQYKYIQGKLASIRQEEDSLATTKSETLHSPHNAAKMTMDATDEGLTL